MKRKRSSQRASRPRKATSAVRDIARLEDIPNFGFDRLGVRVPALFVSPWVERAVLQTEFDHTSLLKYLTEKWGLGPLTERVARAQSFGSALPTTGQPRTDTPASMPLPVLAAAPEVLSAGGPGEPLNGHQKALIAF